jgi:hypothetical protein
LEVQEEAKVKKAKILVIAVACVVGLGLLWSSFGARALLVPDGGTAVPSRREQRSSESKLSFAPSVPLRIGGEAGASSSDRRLTRLEGGEPKATNTPVSIEPTNTPVSLEPTNTPVPLEPTNTPAAPEGQRSEAFQRLPAPSGAPEAMEQAEMGPPVLEQPSSGEAHAQRALKRAELLREADVRFQVRDPGARSPASISRPSTVVVSIDPPAITVEQGAQFSVAVLAENVNDLGGFEFDLHYSPSVVHVVDMNLASFPGSTGRTWSPVGPDIDNGAGVATFGGFSFGSQGGASGTGELAVVTLSVQGANGDVSPLDLRNVQVLDTEGTGQSVTAQDGQVTIGQAETCVDLIVNPQMDVVEFGDGTGSAEPWVVLVQNTYYNTAIYQSPSYSLGMIDEDDGTGGDASHDYDAFGQAFQAPEGLTYLKISFNRYYVDPNANDIVWSNLWTVDSEGYLEDLVAYRTIGESPSGWNNRYWELNSSELAAVSGRTLALVFDMAGDRANPGEEIWLDDAQVRACYATGSVAVHLPLVMRQPAAQPGPTCSPREPDSINQRGSTDVGATCSGSLGPTDLRDFYSLNLNGASAVRLRLFNLPSGTNWGGGIYEAVEPYPQVCFIGTPGHGDKFTDCNLNPSQSYFVLIDRGPQQISGGYNMSVIRR